jgi:hypothetical protein
LRSPLLRALYCRLLARLTSTLDLLLHCLTSLLRGGYCLLPSCFSLCLLLLTLGLTLRAQVVAHAFALRLLSRAFSLLLLDLLLLKLPHLVPGRSVAASRLSSQLSYPSLTRLISGDILLPRRLTCRWRHLRVRRLTVVP